MRQYQRACGLQDRVVGNRVRPIVVVRQITFGGGEVASSDL